MNEQPVSAERVAQHAARKEEGHTLRSSSTPPLAIDLFCGLGGWTDGLIAEGYYVVGFDIERHDYGAGGYPAQLVLQDVLTLHGRQFKDAALIVASPPCQEYSYMAMPWSKAKAKERDLLEGRDDPKRLTALFDACFRIQREACEAAGRHIPMVVENVRGAQKWVGRSRWNFGSFHLWGDVPALMPIRKRSESNKIPPHINESIRNGKSPARWTNSAEHYFGKIDDGVKAGPAYRGQCSGWGVAQYTGSKSASRKAASASIAKIPLPLSRHIASMYRP